MERVKKIEPEDPNSLNNIIDSCEWDDDLKLTEIEKKLAREYLKEEIKKLENYDQAV